MDPGDPGIATKGTINSPVKPQNYPHLNRLQNHRHHILITMPTMVMITMKLIIIIKCLTGKIDLLL